MTDHDLTSHPDTVRVEQTQAALDNMTERCRLAIIALRQCSENRDLLMQKCSKMQEKIEEAEGLRASLAGTIMRQQVENDELRNGLAELRRKLEESVAEYGEVWVDRERLKAELAAIRVGAPVEAGTTRGDQ